MRTKNELIIAIGRMENQIRITKENQEKLKKLKMELKKYK